MKDDKNTNPYLIHLDSCDQFKLIQNVLKSLLSFIIIGLIVQFFCENAENSNLFLNLFISCPISRRGKFKALKNFLFSTDI